MTENQIAKIVVDVAYNLHVTFGPGLLESVYETLMCYELERRGLRVSRQQILPLIYNEIVIEEAFRADIIVEDKVIIEIKSVEQLAKVHYKQVLTYLKVADKKLGLLINFGDRLIKDGIKRIANGLEDEDCKVPMDLPSLLKS
ncbi:MAG TPA: GxxExxY protein [Blastocatellia bacterium]|nr:GxxExxY protein [Blastocatellia bacterium]HMV84855.1 GxxExxY protein [Blastocatellia bacterium]HMX26295.1 GxxExxY protein [Blastocatellia bacterium]HMY73159.1 GxxExxY protein [Blastocatellia bacterium]HMZ22340.1 GxxExxY protein [Blastocatellia bacterium]